MSDDEVSGGGVVIAGRISGNGCCNGESDSGVCRRSDVDGVDRGGHGIKVGKGGVAGSDITNSEARDIFIKGNGHCKWRGICWAGFSG